MNINEDDLLEMTRDFGERKGVSYIVVIAVDVEDGDIKWAAWKKDPFKIRKILKLVKKGFDQSIGVHYVYGQLAETEDEYNENKFKDVEKSITERINRELADET